MPKDKIRHLEVRGNSFRYVRWVGNRRIQRPLAARTLAEAIALQTKSTRGAISLSRKRSQGGTIQTSPR